MVNQKTERVELHLHTRASEDTSVITPKDAIETAVKMGHKAVAITCLNSVQDFAEMERCQWKYGNGIKVIYGAEIKYVLPGDNLPEHITVLAKDKDGLQALYRLISSLEDNGIMFAISKELLEKNRAHLLLGSHHFYGELYRAVRDGAPEQRIKELAAFYDYIELYTRSDDISKEVNRKLYHLGKRLGIPVVAVGNCHYIEPEDQICKKVIDHIHSGIIEPGSTYFRTTEEMLQEFSYLGEEAAYEVVVTNTNKIADQIDYICPFSCQYPPFTLPNANEEIRRLCEEKLSFHYGISVPEEIRTRLETELELLGKYDYSSLYLLTHCIVKNIHQKGAFTGCRGSIGSTLIAYFLDITDVNPLPAHYLCKSCRHTEFVPDAVSGFDLPMKPCPQCGAKMGGDGHNIPYETAMDLNGELTPTIEINVPKSMQKDALQFIAEHLGKDRVAFAGTVGHYAQPLANAYVQVYQDMYDTEIDETQLQQITDKLCNIKHSEGRQPFGVVLLPENMAFEVVTPIRRLEKTIAGIENVTHMDYYSIGPVLPKINILPHTGYDRLKKLFVMTDTKPENIDYSDRNVYQLFYNLDTLGVPDFSSLFCQNILCEVEDIHFGDLVRISGMSHGTNAWLDNAENQLKEHPFRELIGDRDDIFLTLRKYGVDRQTAYSVMTAVRKGRFHLDNERNKKWTALLEQAGVPDWYITSMKKIRYLFPKAHAAVYTKLAFGLAWFKNYFPEQFYNVTLEDMGAEKYLRCSDEELEQQLDALEEADSSHDAEWDAIRLLLEARQRGFAFKSSNN